MSYAYYLDDTYPDHWKCRICETQEPHVHKVYNLKCKTWFYEDHGYDSRDEENHGSAPKN